MRSFDGSPAISVLLKQGTERTEMEIRSWSQLMCPHFSHLRELSQKVQVSHTGVSEDFEKALASGVGE